MTLALLLPIGVHMHRLVVSAPLTPLRPADKARIFFDAKPLIAWNFSCNFAAAQPQTSDWQPLTLPPGNFSGECLCLVLRTLHEPQRHTSGASSKMGQVCAGLRD